MDGLVDKLTTVVFATGAISGIGGASVFWLKLASLAGLFMVLQVVLLLVYLRHVPSPEEARELSAGREWTGIDIPGLCVKKTSDDQAL